MKVVYIAMLSIISNYCYSGYNDDRYTANCVSCPSGQTPVGTTPEKPLPDGHTYGCQSKSWFSSLPSTRCVYVQTTYQLDPQTGYPIGASYNTALGPECGKPNSDPFFCNKNAPQGLNVYQPVYVGNQ